VFASVAVVAAFTAVPAVAAEAASSPGTSAAAGLAGAFEAARHIPAADLAGVRAGTLHTGSSDGREWAIASFTPARAAVQKVAADFQDGAATGVFTKKNGTWRLVQSGLYGCAAGLPSALKKAWHLGDPAVCAASASAQSKAAKRALAALPASARAAARTAATAKAAARTAGIVKTGATVRATAAGAATSAATPDFGPTIAAIALSQVGVDDSPVVNNFNGVDCDPYTTMVAGFSADSDGCGYDSQFGVENENETWCSDFNKWVWEQAGVTADLNTINAGAVSYYDWALAEGQTPQLDTGTPEPGDSIVFFNPYNFPYIADHVGVVSSVSSDGTIDMVNGDFAANPDVHVEYDTDITNLTTWAAGIWGPGEEWAIVSPPTTAQQARPLGLLAGPSVAVAGTTGQFAAYGITPGSSVTGYYWTFGDSRTTNATGTEVTHYFSEPGTYTVSVTLTSGLGTVTTLVRNITVLAASSAVASAPYDGIYYDPLPILQYTFTRSAGGLAVDSWDGGAWLQLAVPGDPSSTGNIAALSYPDAANADAMTPHAYYRAADGSLAETYQSTSGWVTQELPGQPVAGGAIVATTTLSGGPAVYFVDTAGNLAQSALGSSGWTTSEVLTGIPSVSAASLTLTDTVSGPQIFAVGPDGTIRVFSSFFGLWSGRGIPAKTAAGGSLAALTTPAGQPSVVYVDAHGGGLAEATAAGPTAAGQWTVADLPGSPATGTSLAATTYLLPAAIPATPGDFPGQPGSTTSSTIAEPLGTEAFYLTASGAPAVTYNAGTGWQTATLPGTATGIVAATAYQVEEEPSNLYLSTSAGLTEETTGARSGDPSGTWTSMTLPDSPATWANQILLYAADPADASAAQAAATAAGLPASDVTTSFAVAWADTLSGQYLVFAVGGPAVAALYFDVCGWSNPSALPAGSTPFYYYVGEQNTLPGADAFVDAASDTAADTQALATDLAYYALNGTLPAGATSLPVTEGPPYACVGSPS
jgi:PKD domain-containing protein/CHAP domain-containing protein